MPNTTNNSRGFSILELVIAAGAFLVFATAAVGLFSQSLKANRLSGDEVAANTYITEALDAARSIRDRSFNDLAYTTGSGLTRTGPVANTWNLMAAGTSDSLQAGKYTRTTSVACAQRASLPSGTIVASGGVCDPDLKKVNTTVSWTVNGQPRSRSSFTYLSNFKKPINVASSNACTQWEEPNLVHQQTDIEGDSLVKVTAQGEYYYTLASTGGTGSLIIIDNDLSVRGSVAINSVPRSLVIRDNKYAYVVTSDIFQELEVYSVSDPDGPYLINSIDLSYNFGVPNDIKLSDNQQYAYVVTDFGGGVGDPVIFTVDTSDPENPIEIPDPAITWFNNAIALEIQDNYAFVATDNPNDEVMVIDISNPSNLSVASHYDIPQASGAISLSRSGDTLAVGDSQGKIYYLDIGTATNISALGFADTGDSPVYALADHPSLACTFFATSQDSTEFGVVDTTDTFAPTVLGTVDIGSPQYGVAFSEHHNRVIVVGADPADATLFASQ